MSRPKLRILHINSECCFRGGEVQTLGVMEGLRKQGHFCALSARRGAPLAEKARSQGFLTQEITVHGELDFLSGWAVGRFACKNNIDVIHAHAAQAGALSHWARGRHTQLKVVVSRRVNFPVRRGRLGLRKYLLANAVLAVSSAVRNKMIESGVPQERVLIAHDGVDRSLFENCRPRDEMRKELGIPPGSFVIGQAGAFNGHKGQDRLIQAFNTFALEHPEADARLVLAGQGPYEAECKTLAQSLKRENDVLFLGQRQDLPDIHQALDVFFLSTITNEEGLSCALREAMTAGLPCIATRFAPMLDSIRKGENGLLVDPVDVNDWARALETLYTQPDKRKALAAQAHEDAKLFSMEHMTRATEAAYYHVLGLGVSS